MLTLGIQCSLFDWSTSRVHQFSMKDIVFSWCAWLASHYVVLSLCLYIVVRHEVAPLYLSVCREVATLYLSLSVVRLPHCISICHEVATLYLCLCVCVSVSLVRLPHCISVVRLPHCISVCREAATLSVCLCICVCREVATLYLCLSWGCHTVSLYVYLVALSSLVKLVWVCLSHSPTKHTPDYTTHTTHITQHTSYHTHDSSHNTHHTHARHTLSKQWYCTNSLCCCTHTRNVAGRLMRQHERQDQLEQVCSKYHSRQPTWFLLGDGRSRKVCVPCYVKSLKNH